MALDILTIKNSLLDDGTKKLLLDFANVIPALELGDVDRNFIRAANCDDQVKLLIDAICDEFFAPKPTHDIFALTMSAADVSLEVKKVLCSLFLDPVSSGAPAVGPYNAFWTDSDISKTYFGTLGSAIPGPTLDLGVLFPAATISSICGVGGTDLAPVIAALGNDGVSLTLFLMDKDLNVTSTVDLTPLIPGGASAVYTKMCARSVAGGLMVFFSSGVTGYISAVWLDATGAVIENPYSVDLTIPAFNISLISALQQADGITLARGFSNLSDIVIFGGIDFAGPSTKFTAVPPAGFTVKLRSRATSGGQVFLLCSFDELTDMVLQQYDLLGNQIGSDAPLPQMEAGDDIFAGGITGDVGAYFVYDGHSIDPGWRLKKVDGSGLSPTIANFDFFTPLVQLSDEPDPQLFGTLPFTVIPTSGGGGDAHSFQCDSEA